MKKKGLDENLDIFLRHIDAINDSLPMTLHLIEPYKRKSLKVFTDFMTEKIEVLKGTEGEKNVLLTPADSTLFESMERNLSISLLASKIIPESLFVSLISQYDAFLNRLLREIFIIKPEILNGSDRNISFSQLTSMGSLDEAREYVVEKEIDTILRKNHQEQLDTLKNKVGVEFEKYLPSWNSFIEMTERRNLLVHCDGVVSNQYLKSCQDHGIEVGSIKVGDKLNIKPEYFVRSYQCLYEISVKLTHMVRRKLQKDEHQDADTSLNSICFNLIKGQAYDLADNLLHYACNTKPVSSEVVSNMFKINAAISKYLNGDKDQASKILDSKDWSASSYDFKLAYKVLKEQYSEAYVIMKKIGVDGDITKSGYTSWPLFNVIRNEPEFLVTFKSIFNEDFKILETPMRPVQELLGATQKENQITKEKTKNSRKKSTPLSNREPKK